MLDGKKKSWKKSFFHVSSISKVLRYFDVTKLHSSFSNGRIQFQFSILFSWFFSSFCFSVFHMGCGRWVTSAVQLSVCGLCGSVRHGFMLQNVLQVSNSAGFFGIYSDFFGCGFFRKKSLNIWNLKKSLDWQRGGADVGFQLILTKAKYFQFIS